MQSKDPKNAADHQARQQGAVSADAQSQEYRPCEEDGCQCDG